MNDEISFYIRTLLEIKLGIVDIPEHSILNVRRMFRSSVNA